MEKVRLGILASIIEGIFLYYNDYLSLIFILALKIHVSPQTKEVLDTFGTFELKLRGEVEMKVKPFKTLFVIILSRCYNF